MKDYTRDSNLTSKLERKHGKIYMMIDQKSAGNKIGRDKFGSEDQITSLHN